MGSQSVTCHPAHICRVQLRQNVVKHDFITFTITFILVIINKNNTAAYLSSDFYHTRYFTFTPAKAGTFLCDPGGMQG